MQVIAARYGVLLEKAGIALRGLFIINPEGIIQQITVNDLVGFLGHMYVMMFADSTSSSVTAEQHPAAVSHDHGSR